MSCTTVLLVAAILSHNSGRHQTPPLKAQAVRAAKSIALTDISGYYNCRGADSNGKRYKGIAVVVKKNQIYVVQWTIGIGSSFVGIGIRKGDTLAISWAMPDEKRFMRGVNMYQIHSGETGPRLEGQWATLPGNGILQTETLTFLKKLD